MKEEKRLRKLLKEKKQKGYLMENAKRWKLNTIKVFLFLLVFTCVNILSPELVDSAADDLLSIATFAFAILLGFSLSRRYLRFSEVKNALRFNDAKYIEIYQHSSVFSKKHRDNIRKIIDNLLVSQIDYYLVDYAKTLPELVALRDYIYKKITPRGFRQEQSYYYMLDACKGLLESSKKIEHNINDKMPRHEWAVLIVLAVIVWVSLIMVGSKEVISLFAVPALAASIFYVLLILRQVDDLGWNEDEWIWDPLARLFITLDLRPYFPSNVFVEKKVSYSSLHKYESYRVAFYPDKYPEFSSKEVVVFKRDLS